MYFVSTNVVKTIVEVGVMCLPSKKQEILKIFIFAELLRFIVDCVDHIHMCFVSTNVVETIVEVGVVSPPKQKEKC